jgi:hypothetical protein
LEQAFYCHAPVVYGNHYFREPFDFIVNVLVVKA